MAHLSFVNNQLKVNNQLNTSKIPTFYSKHVCFGHHQHQKSLNGSFGFWWLTDWVTKWDLDRPAAAAGKNIGHGPGGRLLYKNEVSAKWWDEGTDAVTPSKGHFFAREEPASMKGARFPKCKEAAIRPECLPITPIHEGSEDWGGISLQFAHVWRRKTLVLYLQLVQVSTVWPIHSVTRVCLLGSSCVKIVRA